MKRTIMLSIAVFALGFAVSAQNADVTSLNNKIGQLEGVNAKLNTQIKANQKAISDLTLQLEQSSITITALQADLTKTNTLVQQMNTALESKLQQTETASTTRINDLDKTISNTSLYWLIALVIVAAAAFFLFYRINSRVSKEYLSLSSFMRINADNLKKELGDLIIKKNDELKSTLTSEFTSNDENLKSDFTDRIEKKTDVIRDEFLTNLKSTASTLTEHEMKLEADLAELKKETKTLFEEAIAKTKHGELN
jgi:predicted RNase H-like nuclease (RuvC/YqgF family)